MNLISCKLVETKEWQPHGACYDVTIRLDSEQIELLITNPDNTAFYMAMMGILPPENKLINSDWAKDCCQIIGQELINLLNPHFKELWRKS